MTSLNVVRKGDGVIWVVGKADEAFRKALMAGVPPSIRPKMHEALSVIPDAGAMAHSVRYFGPELADIKNRIAPLLINLDRFLRDRHGMPSIFDWLQATNYGSDYRMIKAFAAWAEMVNAPSLAVVTAPHPEASS